MCGQAPAHATEVIEGIRLPVLARTGHGPMSDLSPLSGVNRKSDFGAVRSVNDCGHSGRAPSPLPQLSPCLLEKCKGAGERVNASIFLHLWIGSGVAHHVVRAGSQSGLRLVLRALQTSGNLFGAACSRDLLCLRAADGEWPDLRSQWVYSRASHAALRIACNGDKPSERELCYGGD